MAKHPNYELLEELGRGQNSVVHRAYDLLLGRDVAIKELTSEPGSDGGQSDLPRIERFLKEASFLAQFEHENVLRIHTVEQERGWIVMELMKGTLSSQIADRPMDADTVRSVLRQILTALNFLHQRDKVHGAVRPSNILINEHGTVKLSDFEASSRDGELRAPTGSKKYLAPELIRSEFGEFGPAVDLYCLGFTALELLTGKKFDSLFPGTGDAAIDADVAWLRWHSSDEAMRPVQDIVKHVPGDLASVIDALLKKEAADRPQSAAEVLKLLDDAPLVPVPVPDATAQPSNVSDPAAILPSSAVTLREPKRRKSPKQAKSVTAKPRHKKGSVNEVLGRPYVLWPICIGILAAALFVGLNLRGTKTDPTPDPIAGITPGPPTEPVEQVNEPVKTLLAVELRVLPDSDGARLTVGGEPRGFADLELEPGTHKIKVDREGFEPFVASLDINEDNTQFDITLKEIEAIAKTKKPTDPVEPEPKFVDIRVVLSPTNAELRLDGQPTQLNDGVLRLNRDELDQLQLSATAEGYELASAAWTWDQLAAADFDIEISLRKTPAPPTPAFTLPESLIAKPDAEVDEQTQLPKRAFVRTFFRSNSLEMALVSPGDYAFGVQEGKPRTWEIEGDRIVVDKPFYIGVDEVSNAQYQQFAAAEGVDHDAEATDDLPVANVSVREAAQFCDWVGGRLPTEAEWEAAVRGPNDAGFPLPWGDGALDANKCKLFRGEKDKMCCPTRIGELTAGANELGLLNTIGNLSEWCATQYSADAFVIKGCSYRIPPGNHVRVTWRNYAKWSGANDVGMRLMVPVVEEANESLALSFVAPTNLNDVLASANDDDEDAKQPQKFVYTKSVQEIADEFTTPAELVIDSGGFMDEVTDLKFSPDGKRIAVSGGKLVRIWDVESGNLVETLRGDMSRTSYGNVNAVAYSPDGKSLLVGVSDYRQHGNIRIYDTANFEEITELLVGHTAPCRKLCFSRDGRLMTSVDADGLALVWDWPRRTVIKRIPARDREQPIFDHMSFPTNEPYLIGIDFEGPQVYSATTGDRLGARDEMPPRVRGWLVDIYNKLAKLPYGAEKEPRVLDFRMEENRWAGAGSAIVDGRSRFWIRIWESRDPVQSATPATEVAAYDKHRWNVTALAMQPEGSLVASADKFGEVHVWDSQTGERLFKFAGQGQPIYEVAFDKNSSRLAFGTDPHTPKDWKRNNYGNATRVLDLRQRAIQNVTTQTDLQLNNETPTLGDAAVSVRKQGASYFVEQTVNSQTQSRYRISAGRNPTVFTLLGESKLGVQQPVIFGDNEGLLALWDTATDELKRAYIGHGNLVSGITRSRNGKLIATSSTDRTIRLWSLEDHVPTGTFDFKYENSAVREVIPGSSSAKAGVKVGDRIVSIDGKSLTEMFELLLLGKFESKPGDVVPVKLDRSGRAIEYGMTLVDGYDFAEPILNFYMGDNGQWIIWHPQGYYDASPGADRLIGWHLNRGPDKSSRFFEVQQFRKELYRPDIIDGILEHGSLDQALANLDTGSYEEKPVDFRDTTVIAEHHPPGVQITWPSDGFTAEARKLTVKGEAFSVNGLPLTALTLLHNGSVAKVFRPTKVNQIAMIVEHEVQLQPGANDLVLIAANAKASSQGKHIVVDHKGSATPNQPTAVVLAIGVSEFSNSLTSLPTAASDASAFVTAIESQKNGRLYGDVKTKLLSGKVSDSQIVEGLQWLADNTSDGDVAMVFVASHGLIDRRDNFYIGASNTSEAKARSTAVSWRELTDTLQLDLPDCKRMVFLDLEPTRNALKPGMRSPLLDLAAPEMGTVFLSANTLQQKPTRIAAGSNGAFLQAVLGTVADRAADTNPSSGDSMFNPIELAAGVTSRVKHATRDQQQTVFFTPEYAKFTNVLELQK